MVSDIVTDGLDTGADGIFNSQINTTIAISLLHGDAGMQVLDFLDVECRLHEVEDVPVDSREWSSPSG
jgi:hypothetical protein